MHHSYFRRSRSVLLENAGRIDPERLGAAGATLDSSGRRCSKFHWWMRPASRYRRRIATPELPNSDAHLGRIYIAPWLMMRCEHIDRRGSTLWRYHDFAGVQPIAAGLSKDKRV